MIVGCYSSTSPLNVQAQHRLGGEQLGGKGGTKVSRGDFVGVLQQHTKLNRNFWLLTKLEEVLAQEISKLPFQFLRRKVPPVTTIEDSLNSVTGFSNYIK